MKKLLGLMVALLAAQPAFAQCGAGGCSSGRGGMMHGGMMRGGQLQEVLTVPVAKARWEREDGWLVLVDNNKAIARFKGGVNGTREIKTANSWVRITEELVGVNPVSLSNGWQRVNDTPIVEEKADGSQLRFWSNGRWLIVH